MSAGIEVSQKAFGKLFGLAQVTIDEWIEEGMPWCAEVSEVRLYTSLNSTAARFYIGADRPDLAAACFANPCSLDQNGLARRGEVLQMRVKASPDAAVARLHASTRRPDIGGTVPYDSSLLRHCACCRKQHGRQGQRTDTYRPFYRVA